MTGVRDGKFKYSKDRGQYCPAILLNILARRSRLSLALRGQAEEDPWHKRQPTIAVSDVGLAGAASVGTWDIAGDGNVVV